MKFEKFLPSFSRQQRRRKIAKESKAFVQESVLPELIFPIEEVSSVTFLPKLVIEVGSGNGETAIRFAELNLEISYIACEVFEDGVLQTANKVNNKKLNNLRIFNGDGRFLLEKLENCVDKIFLFFPDPWPKSRHHKRRIFTEQFLEICKKALKVGGVLLVATDHENYNQHIVEICKVQKILEFAKIEQPQWWVETKYQSKAVKEGRSSNFYSLIKRA